MKSLTKVRLVLLCGAALLPPAAANAQTSPVPAPDNGAQATAHSEGNGDIVVTAQRREQRLQDVPVAVSVVSGETMAKMNIRSLEDISSKTPALKVARQSNSDVLTIRGVGSGQNGGFEQAVGTFVDGIYRGRSRSSRAALFDIERVEVLKGPQTTYFGNNTIAGALNITTRRPSDRFGFNVTALGTPRTEEYSLDFGITGPIGDTLAVRAAGKIYGMNGYVYNDFLDEHQPHLRDLIGRVSLRWEPSSNFRSDVRVDVIHNRDRGTHFPEIVDCPPPAAYGPATGPCATYLAQQAGNIDTAPDYRNFTGRSYFNYDMVEVAATNALDLGAGTLTATTGYFHHKSEYTTHASPIGVLGVAGFLRVPFLNPERYTSFSQELRYETDLGGTFEYMIGAYYLHGNLYSEGYTGFYSSNFGSRFAPAFYTASDPIAAHRQLHQKEDNLSGFGALNIKPADAFRINLGARYTKVRKNAHRFIEYGIGGDIPGPGNFVLGPAAAQPLFATGFGHSRSDFTDPDASFEKFLPSISLQYDIVPQITAYASYAKGFKAGGFADANTPNTFESETANAFEIGIKGTIAGGLFFSLDVFSSTFNNLQESFTLVLPSGVTSTSIANAAKARARGVEGNFNWRLSPFFSLRADASYVDSKYLSYPNASCTALQLSISSRCNQDLSGRVRAFAPAFTAAVGASAQIPLGPARSLRIEPSLYYTSGYYQSPSLDPLTYQPKYAKLDTRVSYGADDGSWEVAVIGRNLTDKYTFGQSAPLGGSNGTRYIFPDEPRTISFSLTLRH